MVVLVLGHRGSPVTTMMARAPSAAVHVGLAHVTDLWPGVVVSSARAQPSRWQTVPGTVSLYSHYLDPKP